MALTVRPSPPPSRPAIWKPPVGAAEISPSPARESGFSMQTRPLEKPIALARFHPHVHGVAVAVDRDRHVDAGFALGPDAAKEACQVAHFLAGDREHDVAGAQVGLLRRSLVGEADDD